MTASFRRSLTLLVHHLTFTAILPAQKCLSDVVQAMQDAQPQQRHNNFDRHTLLENFQEFGQAHRCILTACSAHAMPYSKPDVSNLGQELP